MSTTEIDENANQTAPDTGSQLTAENRSVEVDGDTFVYRRFGNEQTDVPPLVCLQHFRGNLDNWDPILVDRLARDRDVILLANRGVGASTGVVPDNVHEMTRDRRIVLAGTAPQGGPDLHRWSEDVYTHAAADEINAEHALNVFFSGSEESRGQGDGLPGSHAGPADRKGRADGSGDP